MDKQLKVLLEAHANAIMNTIHHKEWIAHTSDLEDIIGGIDLSIFIQPNKMTLNKGRNEEKAHEYIEAFLAAFKAQTVKPIVTLESIYYSLTGNDDPDNIEFNASIELAGKKIDITLECSCEGCYGFTYISGNVSFVEPHTNKLCSLSNYEKFNAEECLEDSVVKRIVNMGECDYWFHPLKSPVENIHNYRAGEVIARSDVLLGLVVDGHLSDLDAIPTQIKEDIKNSLSYCPFIKDGTILWNEASVTCYPSHFERVIAFCEYFGLDENPQDYFESKLQAYSGSIIDSCFKDMSVDIIASVDFGKLDNPNDSVFINAEKLKAKATSFIANDVSLPVLSL